MSTQGMLSSILSMVPNPNQCLDSSEIESSMSTLQLRARPSMFPEKNCLLRVYLSASSPKVGNLDSTLTVWTTLLNTAKTRSVSSGRQMSYLYGNRVIKAHITRMTESIPQYAPVCVFNLNDLPLGFGVAARGTFQTKELEPTAVVIFNQADTGEYIRTEDD